VSTLRVASSAVAVPCDDSMVIAGSILPTRVNGAVTDLRATAVVIEADVPVCIVSCDVIAIPAALADRAAKQIAAQTDVPFENIMIVGTHTHHAPTTIDVHGYKAEKEFCEGLVRCTARAATNAWQSLRKKGPGMNDVEAEMGFALSQEATVGQCSRRRLRDGSISWRAHDPEEIVRPTGPFDPDLPVVAFRRPGGEWAGVLFNHSTHNMGPCGKGRSPGFYGLAAQQLERELGGRFLFLPGAFGSTHNQTVPDVEAAHRIRAAVRSGLHDLAFGLIGPVQCMRQPFHYHVRHFDEDQEHQAVAAYCRRYLPPDCAETYIEVFRKQRAELAPHQGKSRQTWLQVVRLGQVVLVGVPGEMFCALGLAIRRRSPFRHTFVVGLANDWIGYIPDRGGMQLGGYQVWTGSHSYAKEGTGERMVEEALDMLRQLECVGCRSGTAPRLRPLRTDDALRLQQFYNGLSSESRTFFRPLGWNATYARCVQVARESKEGKRYDVAAESMGRIVGWAFTTGMDSVLPHLGIACADDLHGCGLGTRMMQCLVDEAKRQHKKGIDLILVQSNDRALRLYKKFGFRIVGSFERADGLPYYKMQLDLSSSYPEAG